MLYQHILDAIIILSLGYLFDRVIEFRKALAKQNLEIEALVESLDDQCNVMREDIDDILRHQERAAPDRRKAVYIG